MNQRRSGLTNTQSSFMHGAMILIAANVIVKIIGALFKVPLTNLIGSEGMGYFQTAYSIYQMLFVLSTAGLPVAISKMVSENAALGRWADVKRIFNVSLLVFMAVGLAASLIMFFGADAFSKAANNDKAMTCVLVISPAIFFVAIMSTFRGFFQGLSNMIPTAMSQVVEAAAKLIIGFLAAYMIIKAGLGIDIAASGAVTGITVGSILGAILMWVYYKRSARVREIKTLSKGQTARPKKAIFKQLLKIAIPVTIGASVISITNLIDLLLVMNRLGDAGFTQAQANSLYGTYTAMAVTLFNLPPSIVVSLSISIIPIISAAYAVKDRVKLHSTIGSGLRIGMLIAMPCAIGLASMSKPILSLIFFTRPDEVEIASPLLTSLGAGVLFVCMVSITNSMLQAISRPSIPVFTMLCGGVVKLVTNYFLVGTPSININGAPIGTTLCYATITILNFIMLFKTTHIRPNFLNMLIKPLVSAAAMGVGAVVCYNVLSGIINPHIATLAAMFIAAFIYFFMLVALRGFIREDMLLMPKGKKLVSIMERFGWIKRERISK